MGFGSQSGISQGTWTDFEVRQVAIADITCPEGGRSVGSIEQLAESIRDVGLLNPIAVTADLRLIAGQHRLAAFKLLGKDQIPARILSATEIRTHLARLDENLLRSELTALERAEHLYQRKRVFESLYPDTKRGGNRGNQYTGGKPRQMARSAFCHTAAARFGRSDRSIRQYVQIAQKLSDETRERIRGTPIQDNADTLVRLSRLPREDQRAVVEIMLERGLRSVREASLQATRAKRQAMAGMDVSLSLHLTDNASLRHGDFRELPLDPDFATVLLEWKRRSNGKELVFTSPVTGRHFHASPAQQDYLRPAGWCLVPCSHCGAAIGKRCTDADGETAVHEERRALAMRRKLDNVGWHTFRHTYRARLDDTGAPMGVQQKLMRHADITTTAKYGDALMESKRKHNSIVVRRALGNS